MEAGRKTILDEQLVRDICGAIGNGLTNKSACGLAGVSETTFYRWLQEADESIEKGEETMQTKLKQGINKAESSFIARRLQNIKKQAEENGKWQADAWLLERRFPEQFSNKSSVELTGNTDKPVEVEHKGSIGTYAVMLPDNGRD